MTDHAADSATRPRAAAPSPRLTRAPNANEAAPPTSARPGNEDQLLQPGHRATPRQHQTILGLQRTIGNHAVQRRIQATPPVDQPPIRRQPRIERAPAGGGNQTITDPDAALRGEPPTFKPTGKTLPVGARVEVVETLVSDKRPKGTFVKLVEPGTTKELGWTSQANLGSVQYANAAASFVYVAKVQPRGGYSSTLPVMVYVPPAFDGKQTDIVLYLHGDAADYAAPTSDNYSRENPAIGMHLTGGPAGVNRIVIAPQVNEYTVGGSGIQTKSPWHTLHAGDYETIVQTALTNLQADLKLPAAIPRGAISIAGHSGGGKGLGQAAKDLDTSGGVRDVTLVEAGYGGGEDAKGQTGEWFARSFQMVRDWLLAGKPGKVLRVLTKATSPGSDTRHAIENRPYNPRTKTGDSTSRVPVLGLDGVRNAIKATGREAELEATATEVATDPVKRTGGMQLIRTIVVSRTKGGTPQGRIDVFLMTDPPRRSGVDQHFGVRNATIEAIVAGQGKGDDFARQ